MEKRAFEILEESTQSWWYAGREAIIARALKPFMAGKQGKVLDFGAGQGGMQHFLSNYGNVFAYEKDKDAVAKAATRGYEAVYTEESEVGQKPLYTLIGAFDVLEHIEDDAAAASMLSGLLLPGGILVVSVPAYNFLWSEHDVINHHFRRYTRAGITSLLGSAGFTVQYCTYWNFLLFPLAVIVRLFNKTGEGAFNLPRAIDRLLTGLLRAESLIIPALSFPCGSGIVVVARKNNSPSTAAITN